MWLLAVADDPTHHIRDTILVGTRETPIITMHMVTLIVSAMLTVLFLWLASRAISTGPDSDGNNRYVAKSRLAQLLETMILYLKNELLTPVLGKERTDRYTPFLLTLFFFILFNNLIGLIPLMDLQALIGMEPVIGSTATGNISVTIGLSIVAGIMIVAHGLRDLGVKGFGEHMFGGLLPCPPLQAIALAPVLLLVFVIEVFGLIIKPAALAIRLFANMVAGHLLMAVILSFGASAADAGLGSGAVAGISILAGIVAVLITFLELFVAIVQAFIFMFLTAVFISLLSPHDDHDAQHEPHPPHEMEPTVSSASEPIAA